MTIKELYDWAEEHDVENLNIEIDWKHLNECVNEENLYIDRWHERVEIRL